MAEFTEVMKQRERMCKCYAECVDMFIEYVNKISEQMKGEQNEKHNC